MASSFTTTDEYRTYYEGRIAFWQIKLGRYLRDDRKAHAKRRIAHYKAKLTALDGQKG